jgi:hypothetical protein
MVEKNNIRLQTISKTIEFYNPVFTKRLLRGYRTEHKVYDSEPSLPSLL